MGPHSAKRAGCPQPPGRRILTAVLVVSLAAALLLAGCTGSGPQHAANSPLLVAAHRPSESGHGSSKASVAGGRIGAGRPAGVGAATDSDTQVNVVPATDTARQAELMGTLCAKPIPYVVCAFTPTGPLQHEIGPRRLLTPPYPTCPVGSEVVQVKDTTEVSDSVGVSVSVELGKVVKQAVEASFSATWSNSWSTEVEDVMHLPAHSVGYAYRSAPLLRATGDLFIREVGATLPGTTYQSWYAYQLSGVVFDAPDTSPTAHGSVEFVARPMTAQERAACLSAHRNSKKTEASR